MARGARRHTGAQATGGVVRFLEYARVGTVEWRPTIMKMRTPALFCCLVLASACGGNNIGALFDPDVGGGGGSGDNTNVQAIPVGGFDDDGRPSVVDAFPKGGGWHGSVPIVVVFDESVNEDSVAPPVGSNEPATVFARVQGTQAELPATYDFLLGGRVVVIRPVTSVATPERTPIEIVVDPEMRDADGIRYGGTEPEVVATFTPDAADDEFDAEIVTILPLDNSDDQLRETPVYTIFSRAATATSITTANAVLRTAAGVIVTGGLSFPLELQPTVSDTRVLRFDPATALAGNTEYEIVVDDTILFADGGKLEFSGRTPYSTFQTVAVGQPTLVAVGNASPQFPDKVNSGNFSNLVIDVSLPADALAGDRVRVRLYGLDPETTATNDVNFIERSANVPIDGLQTVSVDFSGELGTAMDPRFEDGDLVITALSERASTNSGFVRSAANNSPRFDLTPPSLVSLGPPFGPGSTDIVTDQNHLVLYGTADEQLGRASLTAGTETGTLFASNSDGTFTLYPVTVGVQPGNGLAYSLTLTDTAGNIMATPLSGSILQRGVVVGANTGTLVVEAYDEATFAPIAGATVVIEPGTPQKPAVGQIVATTGIDGRATFTGLGGSNYSVTIVADGHDLVTLIDTPAAFVSLPTRPLTGSTGSLVGSLAFVPVPGHTALAGLNVFDDPATEAVQTSIGSPGTLPSTAVRPNRPIFATGFAGAFPPTAVSTFATFGCGMCGDDTVTLTPPLLPPTPGDSTSIALTLIPSTGSVVNLAATYDVDFAASGGLGAVVGTPSVNFVASLRGFGGMTLSGVGFAVNAGGSNFTVNGSYAVRLMQTLALFFPTMWVSTEAQDAAGNLARHRRLILDPSLGTTFVTTAAPGIPVDRDTRRTDHRFAGGVLQRSPGCDRPAGWLRDLAAARNRPERPPLECTVARHRRCYGSRGRADSGPGDGRRDRARHRCVERADREPAAVHEHLHPDELRARRAVPPARDLRQGCAGAVHGAVSVPAGDGAVVLLSGGLDSGTAMAMWCADGGRAELGLFADYGQRAVEMEAERSKALAERFGAEWLRVSLPWLADAARV